ncbi:MAG: hypothetical protein EP330_21810 [Deltaproteobacteria bacterium]|nr:MAG: hypothetical protein EP330_21810 [Deltaproteobacteria bacterium]
MPTEMTRPLLALCALPVLAVALACGGDDTVEFEVITPAPTDGQPAVLDGGTRCGGDGLQRVNFWQGEYPDPVIDVQKAVSVPAYEDPCDAKPTATCAIDPAVYHPWAKGKGWVTLRGVEKYTATADFTLGDVAVKQGETVEVPTYLAEGYCMLRVHGKDIEEMCPGVGDHPLVASSSAPLPDEVQLMDPGCGKWVQVDEAFMGRAEVAEGTILGYGEVGPAGALP